MNAGFRPAAAIGAAVLTAGLLGAAPTLAQPQHSAAPAIALTAADAQDIVIDFVRHAQTNPSGDVVAVATNGVPGFPLSALGQQQSLDTANLLFKELGGPGGVAGIFGGQEQRMIETADPFDKLENMTMVPMAGFNEVSGGVYAGAPPGSLGNIAYELTIFAWALGLRGVPMTGSNDWDGNQFEHNVTSAVNTIYADAIADPVTSANGQITDVVYSGGGLISAWPLMNVTNPDVAVFIPLLIETLTAGNANGFLSNAGVTEVRGNPTDGWTLVSFDGHAMPAYPGLLSELIVDLRNVVTAPQTAIYDITQAAINGGSTEIGAAVQAGLTDVGTAYLQFPGAVAGDIADAAQRLGAELAAGESFSDAFGSIIIGLVPEG